ncbi:MAG: iron ABC transporter permease [Alphaproteobacteria bacterium]|nr:iron ABC transporter permease [Alphaproteobacteria bacterium]
MQFSNTRLVERLVGSRTGTAFRLFILFTLLGLTVLAFFFSVLIGSRVIPTMEVLNAIFAFDASKADHLVLWGLRLPRSFLGLAAGAALGVAGVITQGITRNPLGSPGILGINAGAAFAVVAAIYIFKISNPVHYIWFALAGATIAAIVSYTLGTIGHGGRSPTRLALAGMIVGGMLSAWTSITLLTSLRTFDQVRFWLVGSLSKVSFDGVWVIGITMPIGFLLAVVLAASLNTIALGDDMAASLGLKLQRTRFLSLCATVLLAGSATAVAGPIGFVGLAAPHIVRGLIGSDHKWLLPASMFGGAALLLAADIVGRMLVRPSELEAGIVMGLVGAPILIYIARRAGEHRQ